MIAVIILVIIWPLQKPRLLNADKAPIKIKEPNKVQEISNPGLEKLSLKNVQETDTVQVSDYKLYIYDHESGNNPEAVNSSSGACGLGQAEPCSKLSSVCSLSDYACQDAWFTRYMEERYGTWEAAYEHWIIHRNW